VHLVRGVHKHRARNLQLPPLLLPLRRDPAPCGSGRGRGAPPDAVQDRGFAQQVAAQAALLLRPHGDLGAASVDDVGGGEGEGAREAGGDEEEAEAPLFFAQGGEFAVDVGEGARALEGRYRVVGCGG